MEQIKFETVIKGILSIIIGVFSCVNLTLYNFNDKPADEIFWVFVGTLVGIGAAYGINLAINQKLRK